MAEATYADLARMWVDAETVNDDLTCLEVDDELIRRSGEYDSAAVQSKFWQACCAYHRLNRA